MSIQADTHNDYIFRRLILIDIYKMFLGRYSTLFTLIQTQYRIL